MENASLIPWLTGTALVHSAIVVEKREALKIWTVLLAIGTFSFSLSGTFLVRSGILNSVHAFANDPARGVFILGLLALVIGGSLLLFAIRAPQLTTGGLFAPVSREGLLVLNNILLCSICAVVLTGTMYPPSCRCCLARRFRSASHSLTQPPSAGHPAHGIHGLWPDGAMEAGTDVAGPAPPVVGSMRGTDGAGCRDLPDA